MTPMLRSEVSPAALRLGLLFAAVVGAAAAFLVVQGNPGNMGLCGACFLRDGAGAVGLFGTPPRIFRPEVPGVMFGALALVVARRKFGARSGSHAATRFFFGMLMAFGALVFLGCPFRMLQRLGGGDLNALVGLAGFIGGVGAGVWFEKRGYSVGKTAVVPAPVGLLGPLTWAALLAAFLAGGVLLGPGPGDASGPAHAPWATALGVAVVCGALLSATGFCAVSAARQVFQKRKRMLVAALLLIAGYLAVMVATGRFRASFENQPFAHQDALWNVLALALVGLCGVLCGGCPVRQIVMAGEGNGDAFVATCGIALGGAVAHTLGIVSSTTGGPTPAGRTVVVAGLVLAALHGALVRPPKAA